MGCECIILPKRPDKHAEVRPIGACLNVSLQPTVTCLKDVEIICQDDVTTAATPIGAWVEIAATVTAVDVL